MLFTGIQVLYDDVSSPPEHTSPLASPSTTLTIHLGSCGQSALGGSSSRQLRIQGRTYSRAVVAIGDATALAALKALNDEQLGGGATAGR